MLSVAVRRSEDFCRRCFYLGEAPQDYARASVRNDKSRRRGVLAPVSLARLPAGTELLYRSRDGDVLKYNVETEEKTILVHNKKFVSISRPGSVSLSHRSEELTEAGN